MRFSKFYFAYAGRLLSPLVAPLLWILVQLQSARATSEFDAGKFVLFWLVASLISYSAVGIVGLPAYGLLSRAHVRPLPHFVLFCLVGALAGGLLLPLLHIGPLWLGTAMGASAAATYWYFRRTVDRLDGQVNLRHR